MFLKQYNYKPRSNSQSSGSDNTNTQQASSPTEPAGPFNAATAGRRRSSATEKFAGLTNHKRNSSDAAAEQHRSSLLDQKTGAGVLGGMWQNFTKK